MRLLVARNYLLLSAGGVLLAGMLYGAAPAKLLPVLTEVSVETVDQTHVFRSILGLYIGSSALWLVGAFRARLTRGAVVSVVVFMSGLASGRLLSIAVDGAPSAFLIAATVVEIVMAVWGVAILLRPEARPEARLEPA